MTQPDVIEGEYTPSGALAVIEETALSAATGVMPIVTPEEARAQMQAYTELVAAVLTESDYQEFKERGKTKRFKKKSAVKKLQTYFGFTVEVVDTQRDDLGDGHFGFRCRARAKSPNGRFVEAMAGCSTTEERFELTPYDDETPGAFDRRQRKALARAYHDVLSTAETRATNRAAMNLVGAGEVTADEISRSSARYAAPPQRRAEPQAPRSERVQTVELQRLAAALDIESLGDWLVANVAPDLRERRRPALTDEESVIARDRLQALFDAQADAADANDDTSGGAPPMMPTKKQKGMLFALHTQHKHTDADRHALYVGICRKRSFKDLTAAEVAKVIDALSERR